MSQKNGKSGRKQAKTPRKGRSTNTNMEEAELRWLYADNYENMVQQGLIPGPRVSGGGKETTE